MYRIIAPSKVTCEVCGKSQEDISGYLKVCRNCRKEGSEKAMKLVYEAHSKARAKIGLPAIPPKDPKGVKCDLCGNECQIPEGKIGYCGLSKNVKGKLKREIGTKELGLIYSYRDPHPTNCVAAPFCAGGTGAGYPKYSKSKAGPEYGYLNASLFLGTCCSHCLYCQNTNWHRMIKEKRETMKTDELVNWMLSEGKFTPHLSQDKQSNNLSEEQQPLNNRKKSGGFTCMCWFGGTSEPQMPFVYAVSKK